MVSTLRRTHYMIVFINIQLVVHWEHRELVVIKITKLFNPVTKSYNGIFEELSKVHVLERAYKLCKIMAACLVSPFSLNYSLPCLVNSGNSERKMCWPVMICSD